MGKFEKGKSGNPAGRPKGSKNKRNEELHQMAEELGAHPVKILLQIAAGDWKGLGYDKPTETRATMMGPVEVPLITLEMRKDAAGDAAPYLFPKLKSVDLSVEAEDGGFVVIPATPDRIKSALGKDPLFSQPQKKTTKKAPTKKKATKKKRR